MSRPFTSTKATDVKVGDTITYFDVIEDVQIQRITACQYDGWIGLYGNNDKFSLYVQRTDTVRVLNSESTK